jgi:iron complex outermembrane recepter protein
MEDYQMIAFRSVLLAGASFALFAPSIAWAQNAAESDAPAEIIVTAQKRSERLQNVPVAVSVVSGAALEALGKTSLEGAVNLVPSFNFLKSGTTINQSLFLRGVGTATFSIAGEPSVSTVVDGVVYSRSGEAFSELVDIERLEVLRGPQGTLFGKNASAGVVNITSKRPTSELGGYVEAGYFTKSEYRLRAAINAPLGDSVRARLNGFYSNYDGNITNVGVAGNPKVNGWEHYGARLAVDIDLAPTIKLALTADYHKNNDDCCAEVIGTLPIVGGTGLTTTNLSQAALPTPLGDATRTIAQDLVTRTIETGYGFSAQLDAELGSHTLTSITAYRNWKNNEVRDGDFLPAAYIGFNQLHDVGPQTGDTFSQELRLTSPGKQFFDYVVGAYYSVANSARTFTRSDLTCSALGAAPTVLTPCTSPLAAPTVAQSATAVFGSKFKNIAVFAQGTLNLSDRFRIIGGLRYTSDDLSVFHSRVASGLTFDGAGRPNSAPGIQPNFDQGAYNEYLRLLALNPGLVTPLTIDQLQRASSLASNGVPYRTSTSNTNWSGKAGVQFDISKDSMAYATFSRGYKGPAYNTFFNLMGSGTNAISAETSDAYEIGVKNSFMGGKLILNLAGFYAKYSNFQANNPDVVAGIVVSRFTNAGDISTRGFEIDAIIRASRDLSFSGGLAYTDARVDRFNASVGATAAQIIQPGTPLAFAPEWKWTVSGDYRWRMNGPFDVAFGVQTSYQSSQLAQFSPDPIIRRLATIEGYGLANVSVALLDKDDRWKVTFQVRNLFDRSFAAAIANGGPGGAYRYQIPRDADRYFGVTARFNFGGK